MNKTKYNVLIFPKAENDLIETKTYFEDILKTSSKSLFEKFFKEIDTLEENPYIFPIVKDSILKQFGYRIIPIDNYLIFFVINEKEVQIHRFIYGRRNYHLLF
jgi:toxin ParE1/3/4